MTGAGYIPITDINVVGNKTTITDIFKDKIQCNNEKVNEYVKEILKTKKVKGKGTVF